MRLVLAAERGDLQYVKCLVETHNIPVRLEFQSFLQPVFRSFTSRSSHSFVCIRSSASIIGIIDVHEHLHFFVLRSSFFDILTY